MFTNEEWEALLRKLIELTRADKVLWEPDDDGDLLDAVVNGVTYTLGSSDGDGREPFYIAVSREAHGEGNREIDRLESIPLPQNSSSLISGSIFAGLTTGGWTSRAYVRTLRTAAQRYVEGGAKFANSLLADLESLAGNPAEASPDDDGA